MQGYIVNNPQILSSQYDNNPRFFRFQNSILSCRIREKSLHLQSVKNGRFERAEIVKIGDVNLVKINFVDLKRNLLTIKNML